MNVNIFNIFLLLSLTITCIIIFYTFRLAIRENSEKKIKINTKKLYIKNKKNKDMSINIKENLEKGEIKCEILTNNSSPHSDKKWIKSMKNFTKENICKELIKMEGHDIDGEYKGRV